jgi:hypothetical protein
MRTKLREMIPADVPAVLDLLREQNDRDGTSYGVAQVFDARGNRMPNIPLALVAEDVDTGQVVQAHVWERTLEHTVFGTSAEASVCSMHEQAAVWYLLRQKGYRDEHILVPVERVSSLAHGIDSILGMKSTEGLLEHFYRMLDPVENDELRKWYEARRLKDGESSRGDNIQDGPEGKRGLQPGSPEELPDR